MYVIDMHVVLDTNRSSVHMICPSLQVEEDCLQVSSDLRDALVQRWLRVIRPVHAWKVLGHCAQDEVT